MPHGETKLHSEEIFSGHIIRVTVDEVALENGKTSRREIVHHGGGAAIVALNAQGQVALVRQFRYAVGRELTEIPAGKVEKGEDPGETARRELHEEVGCTAASFKAFGSVIPTSGYCTETIYLYLATGLQDVGQQLDEDEFLDVFWMDLDEAVQRVLDGEFTDGKTVAGLLKAHALRQAGKL